MPIRPVRFDERTNGLCIARLRNRILFLWRPALWIASKSPRRSLERLTVTVHPLGDQAVQLAFDDESAAFALAEQVRAAGWSWVIDVVQAYRSVAVFYDLASVDYSQARSRIQSLRPADGTAHQGRLHTIPCCYELGLDLDRVARHTKLTPEKIVSLHALTEYTVYAIGFCPGFPYLGYLPDGLAGVPRLESPRRKVEAGSVGLTGRQTGIYTEERPGGWNILGQTPLELVNVAEGYFPLRTGDRVRFEAISREVFLDLKGRRAKLAS